VFIIQSDEICMLLKYTSISNVLFYSTVCEPCFVSTAPF